MIYVVQVGVSGPLKIGTSIHPVKRFVALRSKSAVWARCALWLRVVTWGDERVERILQDRCHDASAADFAYAFGLENPSEWFRPTQDVESIVAFMEGVAKADPELREMLSQASNRPRYQLRERAADDEWLAEILSRSHRVRRRVA